MEEYKFEQSRSAASDEAKFNTIEKHMPLLRNLRPTSLYPNAKKRDYFFIVK